MGLDYQAAPLLERHLDVRRREQGEVAPEVLAARVRVGVLHRNASDLPAGSRELAVFVEIAITYTRAVRTRSCRSTSSPFPTAKSSSCRSRRARRRFEAQARLLLAVKLDELGRTTAGRAAELARLERVELLFAPGRCGLSPAGVDLEELRVVNEPGLTPDASRLVFDSRWLTPPFAPLRFDNRFSEERGFAVLVSPSSLTQQEWG